MTSSATETQTLQSSKSSTPVIRHAVILAAGKSQRFREKGTSLPKVLLKVGGLRLMERSILTLREVGIEHFYIVLGAYRDQIKKEVSKLPRLKGLDIHFVECPDFELGNGVSFGAGAAQVKDTFLLTMCDHIFSPLHIEEFMARALEQPDLPALACDPKLDEVFDMDDATKVASKNGFIADIGKEIETYDLVDTGLFYFPEGYGPIIAEKARNGAHSVSNIIQDFIDDTGVRAPALQNAMWQDVDYPGMKKEAEQRLMKYIVRPDDGWVARNINRFFSTRLSLLLANRNVHPNQVTSLVFLLSLVGAFFAGSGEYAKIVIGALLFQVASILDGCDGEIARMTYRHSWFGAWYDRLIGNLRFGLFFGALGLSAWKMTGADLYLYATLAFAALSLFVISLTAVKTWRNRKTTWMDTDKTPEPTHFPDKFFSWFRALIKEDVLSFLGLIFCVIFQFQIVFWLALAGTLFMAISHSGGSGGGGKGDSWSLRKAAPFFLFLAGAGMLATMIFKMDFAGVCVALFEVGGAVFWVFATAILWLAFDTLSIANLVRYRVPFADLIFNQLTGNGYNILIPAAGLGGEPYKVKHLTQWLDWHTASRAIVQDRLLHALSGSIFTALITTITLCVVPLDEKYAIPFLIVAVAFSILSVIMIWLTLSSAPSRISGWVLKKLKFLQEFENEQLPLRRFLTSLAFKLTSRLLYLVEIYVIFLVLGIQPGIHEILLVGTMLMMSASIFFMMPQGLGVNEFGIGAAMVLLGYGATIGLTFGLLRRARNLFWGFLGVLLHLTVVLWKKLAAAPAFNWAEHLREG
ncbi:MAG: hypothetical protein D6714_13755 [Bacteroidetes bacterium]|nr:MAG: hypothetical protein D6714_13755 [Bacteroidota bacterium]